MNTNNGPENHVEFTSYLASVLSSINLNTEDVAKKYFESYSLYIAAQGTNNELYHVSILRQETQYLLTKIQALNLDDIRQIEKYFYCEIARLKSLLDVPGVAIEVVIMYKGKVTGIMMEEV